MRYKLSFVAVALFISAVFMSFRNESHNLSALKTYYGGSASVTTEFETWKNGEKVTERHVVSKTAPCTFDTVSDVKENLRQQLENWTNGEKKVSEIKYEIDSCER